MISLLILIAAALHLGAYVCYPDSGRFGSVFLYVSVLIWAGLSIMMARVAAGMSRENKAFVAVAFALAAAVCAISLLPQKDGVSALRKLTSGVYPDKRAVYVGLRRLGVEVPALAPPAAPEKPI